MFSFPNRMLILAASGACMLLSVPAAAEFDQPALTGATQAPVVAKPYKAPAALPGRREAGRVPYMTGGVGADSAAAMRGVRDEFPVSITFALQNGVRNEFTAGVEVRIERIDGTPVLELVTEGPYLYAGLAPGSYRLRARYSPREPQQREFLVQPGQRVDLVVLWMQPS
ncbi:MAG TPA: carboxypeptidase-like regulatory domain-containing protein [Solimonas sp.]|nr:carboxypeptidase-like regulatory domain-containing protein [Solimonas sp.]